MTAPLAPAAEFIPATGISWATVAQLANATPQDEVRQREGPGGRMLSYVDARYVMRRLTEVCGPYWQRDHRAIGDSVACGIGILIDGQWVWRWDGAGETDIEGEKGAFSDSFKRAAVSWGIARDLYPQGTGRAVTPPPARPAALPRPTAVPDDPYPTFDESAVREALGDSILVGSCPIHHLPFRTTKKDGTPSKRPYCSQKMPDGTYCKEPRVA